MTKTATSSRIAQLNDAFRTTFLGGKVVITAGIQVLPEEIRQTVLAGVRSFSSFTKDNDPYGERDFGSFKCQGKLINWKIDYYDQDLAYMSENPADPNITNRVLTIMLAEEY